MIKQSFLAVTLMAIAGVAVAAPEPYSPGETTERKGEATTYEYDVSATPRADRLFVKNNFEFTLSTNVVMTSAEEPADGRFLAVGTYNTQGRNVYVGHSNGGSVSACGEPATAEETKDAAFLAGLLTARFDILETSGCNPG
jgi:hypothetical protein